MKKVTTFVKDKVFFQCRKCEALLYFEVENNSLPVSSLMRLENMDCPECGEEADGNWILHHVERDELSVLS